jgi:hypothetical protein
MVFRFKDKFTFMFVLRAGKVDALASVNMRQFDNRRQYMLSVPLFSGNYMQTLQFICCNFFCMLSGECGG